MEKEKEKSNREFMAYDKNTKLITLDKVVIGGDEFEMTTKEREEYEEQLKHRIDEYKQIKCKYNFEIKKHRTLW